MLWGKCVAMDAAGFHPVSKTDSLCTQSDANVVEIIQWPCCVFIADRCVHHLTLASYYLQDWLLTGVDAASSLMYYSVLLQVHDFWHVLTGCHTNVFGELALKALEFAQVRLYPQTLWGTQVCCHPIQEPLTAPNGCLRGCLLLLGTPCVTSD